MSTATKRVLDIPELLEAILIRLPSLDLIIFQRTNKKFKGVIESSTRIQHKTLSKPRPKLTDGKVALNPFLRHILGRQGIWVSITVREQESGACSYLDRLIGRSSFTNTSDEHLVPANASILISIGGFEHGFIPRRTQSGSWMEMEIASSQIRVEVKIGRSKPYIIQGHNLRAILEACNRKTEIAFEVDEELANRCRFRH